MAKNVEVQKGPIDADFRTGKNRPYSEITREDLENFRLRKDGEKMTFHTPKQK